MALGLAGAGLYFFVVRDRTFSSYSGAEVGMATGTALSRLQRNGYLLVYRSSEDMKNVCSGGGDYVLVPGADPTYSLTISEDRTCKITKITRRLRGREL